MLDDIDADQLIEEYGGSLKLPGKLWPPVDTFSKEARLKVKPINEHETHDKKHIYMPNVNGVTKLTEPTAIEEEKEGQMDDWSKERNEDEELNEGKVNIRVPHKLELKALSSRDQRTFETNTVSGNPFQFSSTHHSGEYIPNDNALENLGSVDISLDFRTNDKDLKKSSIEILQPVSKEQQDNVERAPLAKVTIESGIVQKTKIESNKKESSKSCCQCTLI